MKRLSCFIMALALVLGLSQCKKQMSVTPNVAEQISITLNVDNGDGSKVDVVDGVVSFKQGDVIHVASHGTLRGTLTHNGTNFTGTISGAENGEPLYFYFLGNKTISGEAGSEYIDIDDQTNELPVISMAASEQNYPAAGHVYSATLSNKCALMKFNVTTPSNSPICITGMKNRVNINFGQYADDEANNGFSYGSHDGGVIKMAGGSGSPAVKWAIVLPQSAVGELENGVYTADNNYQGDRPAIRTIEMGKMYSSNPVALEVNELNPEGPTYTPLTFEAKVAGATVTFNASSVASVQYSTDGNTWSDYSEAITLTNVGDKVSFRGNNTTMAKYYYSDFSTFACSKDCYIYGNVMSLINATNYATTTTLTTNNTFSYLFRNNTKLYNHDSKYLVLPATELAQYCYNNMFSGCTRLTSAPELNATTLASYCYQSMFSGCTSLTSAPALNATILQTSCYQSMFSGCTSLTSAPELNATTLASNCYYGMFSGCTSLTSAPELNATTLQTSCYQSMFSGCTSLTSAPELNATTLQTSCYQSMFSGCTSLTSAPTLPVTNLSGKNSCYKEMFKDCTSLISAPALNATTLATSCYESMFSGCTSLTSAPALNATTMASNCYQSMFSGCTSLTSAPALNATTLQTSCYQSMFSGCTSLTSAPTLPVTNLSGKNSCYKEMFKDCTSLISAPALNATTLASSCYESMFSGCTSLTSAPTLNATTLGYSCYQSMFSGCTSLTSAPAVLPATDLNGKTSCYKEMFKGCTNLETAPDLPATTLVGSCYNAMFDGCVKLNSVKCLATSIPLTNCTQNWLNGVAATGTFTKASSMTSWAEGVSGIPSGWTVNNE